MILVSIIFRNSERATWIIPVASLYFDLLLTNTWLDFYRGDIMDDVRSGELLAILDIIWHNYIHIDSNHLRNPIDQPMVSSHKLVM